MAQANQTMTRRTIPVPAKLAAGLAAGAIAMAVLAAGIGFATRPPVAPAGPAAPVFEPRTDRAAILAGLNSEYLRSIAGSWYVDPAVDPGRFYSEYLRELSRDW